MFLAIKEIKHEKLRYGLIVLMIFLISYLIFMLSSLAIGLSSQNTQAIESWNTQRVVLNKNSNINMNQSVLTKEDLKNFKMTKKDAVVGELGIVAKTKGHQSVSAQFLGIKKDQFIYKDQDLVAGKKAKKTNEVTVDSSFKDQGYHLGDKISLNGSSKKYKIVGFVNNAKINIAPIVYGRFATWKKLRMAAPNVAASAVISQNSKLDFNYKDAKTYSVEKFISELPGYTAQNMTFDLMIGFLFVISLIVIAVFLYILTMQKMHNFAVMRAQGIPSKTLISATISQSIILVVIGVIIGLILMWLTALLLPDAVPVKFTPLIALGGTVGMLLMGIIGSLIPIRSILKVDPAKAIGE
ncbi:ABC transporter permease [Lactobacillus kefiranofaciens subsp. kefirgranum]|uniref:ABC transporter permease n=1 Tax=Lactobacillus kefiranofaciens TaxID=267818 RepID=UPI002030D57C|nr:ABC transporter permease [Lactobacillus kefiranofaciens]URW70905.1 ABC transporter permease [Lactobacillus kefiranofaciens subsp. kefirgranum]URW72849.1 ABC transporter permease [Lactobacillus kefiranofaciens subsp. kefirgranum]